MTWALESLENFRFNGLFLNKEYIVWAKKVQLSYVSWQWRMIQKLKRDWLFVLKLTWGTSQILTQAFESLKFWVLIGSLWPKYILFELQKYRGVIFHDTEELCTFWRKTDLWFEIDNLANFHQSTWVSKLGLWWDPFVLSRKGMTLKFTEELCIMAMQNIAKFEEELICHFKTDMRNLTNFDWSTWKSKKIAL